MNIVIIGCGYVGSKLADLLQKHHYVVTCTTRSRKKIATLKQIAQKVAVCKGSNEKELFELIERSDGVILTLAADSFEEYKETYLRTAQSIRHIALKLKRPKTLIYTGSTAVYGEHQGHWVNEESDLLTTSEPGKILLLTENTYLSLKSLGWKICIFRLAEIYGPGRSLDTHIRSLDGHVMAGRGDTFTNLIHVDDVVGAIFYALQYHLEGIYNLADDDHPLRKDLYDQLCEKYQLPTITWDHHLLKVSRGNKRVSNHKIKATGYSLTYPHHIL